jgi:class 3 adenylate cyclase
MVSPVPRALLFVDLVDSTALVEKLGDTRAAEVFEQFDRLARAEFAKHGGREIDRTDGFLVLFERAAPAVATAFDLHAAAKSLSLSARAAVHFGDVVLRENPIEDVQRGAKPLEVDGLAKPVGARLLSLALPGQTLLSPIAVELAKRAQQGGELPAETRFPDHGAYQLKGVSEPIHVHEAGIDGKSPLRAPPRAAKGAPVGNRERIIGLVAGFAIATTAAAVYVTRTPAGPPPIPTYHERRLLSLPADQELSNLSLKADGTAIVYVQHAEARMMKLPDGDPQPIDLGGPVQSIDFIGSGNDLLAAVRTSKDGVDDAPVVRVDGATGAVTPLPWAADRVSVSADGKHALLHKHDGGLWIGDLETTRSTKVGEGINGGWSPDGTSVAALTLSDANDLLRIASNGSSTTTLLKGESILDRYEGVRPVWIDPTTVWIPRHRTVGDNRSGGIERLRLDPATDHLIGRDFVREWPDEKVSGLAIARGGDLWVAARATTQDEVFVMDVGPDGLPIGERKNVTRHRRSDRPTDWLPDGRIVFTSDRAGVFDVLAQRPGEDDAVRLASGPALQTWGRVTHSGALLYWEIVPDGSAKVQRARVMRADLVEGSPPRTLFETDIESDIRLSGRPPPFRAWISCARDVEMCALNRQEGDSYAIRLFDPETGVLGEPVHRVRWDGWSPPTELSPDGTRLARVDHDTITLVSVADQSVNEIHLPHFSELQYVWWRPDGQSVYVTGWLFDEQGRRCVVAFVDLRDGRAVPVRIADSWRGQVTVSWDGSQIAWLEWDGSNDVYLYEATPG